MLSSMVFQDLPDGEGGVAGFGAAGKGSATTIDGIWGNLPDMGFSHRRVYSARSISDKPFDMAVKKLRAHEMTFIVCLLCAKSALGLIDLSS
jgi:hypothetical protein